MSVTALRRAAELRRAGKARGGVAHGLSAGAGDLVVAARWPLFVVRVGSAFPPRREQPCVFEAAEDGIHRSAREPGDIHDLEAVAATPAQRGENDSGRIRDTGRRHAVSISIST